MKRIVILCWWMVLPCIMFGQVNEVAVTIDDLPVVPYTHPDITFQKMVTDKITEALVKNKVPAIGFVNEAKLYDDEVLNQQKVALLKTWLDKGLDLGNHTFSHVSYHRVSYDEYTMNVLQGEKITKELVMISGREYKYFRHPYLQIGTSPSRYDSLREFLSQHKYVEAPVTIDNEDYVFALAYNKAIDREDSMLMKKVGMAYVDYMVEKLLYFHQLSNELFKRNIKQILLMHASALNADYLDQLIHRYQKEGYRFISLDEALTDPAYNTRITNFGNWGISWLERWVLSENKGNHFLKRDPSVPSFVKALVE